MAATSLSSAAAESNRVESPDGSVVVTVNVEDNRMTYTLSSQGQQVLEPSLISLVPGATCQLLSADQHAIDETWEPVWGQFSEVRNHCRELTLKLMLDEVEAHLLVRAYDQAIGFRFVLPPQVATDGLALEFRSELNSTDDLAGYFPRGEREPSGPELLSAWLSEAQDDTLDDEQRRKAGSRPMPGLLERADGSWLSILESDLYSAKLFSASRLKVDGGTRNATLSISAAATADGSPALTPWRVVMLGHTPGDLIENQTPLNLAEPNKIEDPSWIKPGKGLWDWRIHGYDNGDFVYGIDTRSYLRMIDFAAEHGIEYLTIDDHWFTRADAGQMDIAEELDLEKVVQYAHDKGVRVILYYDRNKGDYGDETLFAHYHALGAAGIKYGFMGNKDDFTRASIEGAAAAELLLFHHDSPVPMTGVHRTFPNMITREYCHAQQDSRRAVSPRSFLKMAMVNALSGPLDQANGNFGIESINAGERLKGPRKLNTYVSTVTSEVARTLVIFTGLITLPDAPEEYRQKADLFDFLVQMPATWDETRVLNSKVGTYITTARRSGDTWFVGSVNDETPRELAIDMDFLTPGQTYDVTFFEDALDAHGVKNPEAYRVRNERVRAGEMVTATMALGGGHAMILRPVP